jgi:hypothetical protein
MLDLVSFGAVGLAGRGKSVVSVVVRGRIPGRERIDEVLVDVGAPDTTVRELIGAVVAAQFAKQAAAVSSECSQKYSYSTCSTYLTDAEIAAMAARGRIRPAPQDAASPAPAPTTVTAPIAPTASTTVAEAGARAVEAYQRGTFVVFAGASQAGGIDEPVRLRDGDRVVFLRLTALAGG